MGFSVGEVAQRLWNFDFFEISQKDLDTAEAGGIVQREFALDFADGCGRFYLKGAPFFG